jgi:hypothetical protein
MSADAQAKPESTPNARALSPAARRALAEAEARRKVQLEQEQALAAAREVNGRGGKDPVRYNDWEIKGLASDF